MTISNLRERLYKIIFEADTRTGKIFDVVLLGIIFISVLLVLLESVPGIRKEHHDFLVLSEWIITGIFTAEMIRSSKATNTQVCNNCLYDNHDDDALFCKKCGNKL